MTGPGIAAAVVMVVMVVTGVQAIDVRLGLSWCEEKVTAAMPLLPELGKIPVLVNDTFQENVVDELTIVRAPQSCEGITQAQQVLLDGREGQLVQEYGEINLYWRPPDTVPLFQKVENFCVIEASDSNDGMWDVILAKFCFPNPLLQLEAEMQFCSGVTCVRKCCPQKMAMSTSGMCAPVEDSEEWQPNLGSSKLGTAATKVQMLYGPPGICESGLAYNEFSILPSGMLDIGHKHVNVDSYCIDAFIGSPQPVAMVCQAEASPHCRWKNLVLKPVLLGISSVCLLIVWLVYVSVARLRRSNEGRCLLSLVSAFFVAHITVIVLNFMVVGDDSMLCVVVGRLCHFFVLASYFWMSVLSFHTYYQLKSEMVGMWARQRAFILSSVYAWLCPLLIVVAGVVMDKVNPTSSIPYMQGTCWFLDTSSKWLYLYGPMLVLLLINGIFFVGCMVLLSGQRRQVTFTPSSDQHQICSAWVYVKIFILTGIIWLTEILSWQVFPYCSILQWIFDSVNCLHGVLVFLVTVCFRRDLKVFHCGRPYLIQEGREGTLTTSNNEELEIASRPMIP